MGIERVKIALRRVIAGVGHSVVAFKGAAASTQAAPPSWFQRAGQEIAARGIFVGCPVEMFECSSRDPLCLALTEGLTRDSTVLEVGCGCLRVGFWFIQYLHAGKYFGIEPNQPMLDAGRKLILRETAIAKWPTFSARDDFNFESFETTFDFVVAFSIWSHASKPQIVKILDQFKKTAGPRAKLMASWFPAGPALPDYDGPKWVGRSHESDQPGIVGHRLEWVAQAVASRGLYLRTVEGFTTLNQQWLIVSMLPD